MAAAGRYGRTMDGDRSWKEKDLLFCNGVVSKQKEVWDMAGKAIYHSDICTGTSTGI